MSIKYRRAVREIATAVGVKNVDVQPTRSGHLRITGECGPVRVNMVTSCTPSDRRTDRNLRSDLRRHIRERQQPVHQSA